MRMIPSSPPNGASSAERKVFFALKGTGLPDDTVCLHSLGLPRHAYKACCELDFVLVGPGGLLALEVKGGGVRRGADGAWIMTDRSGQQYRHREGPFRQVQGNLFALWERLQLDIPHPDLDSLPRGWGVVLPDCAFDVKSVEWDDATVADQPRMGHFALWLENLWGYYRRKAGRDATHRVRPELVQRIATLLRPRFEQVPTLAGSMESAEMSLASLTEDQCRAVDVLAANPRVLCSGGAGTGKTFLAVELARRALAEQRLVTLCCSSPWLRNFLDARLVHPDFKVVTPGQARRSSSHPAPADLLIVDEGQDLMNCEDLDLLDRLVHGGLAGGHWALFHDSNHQTGLVGRWDPVSLGLLESYGATRVPLTRNCRNTRPIVDEVQHRTGCDMGRADEGEGPNVEVIRLDATTPPELAAARTIRRLIDENVSMSQITILSPISFKESCASRLPEPLRRDVLPLDEFSLRRFPPPHISFAQIHEFKGLENAAIVLLDLDDRHFDRSAATTLYVGMSRARAYLSLHVRPGGTAPPNH